MSSTMTAALLEALEFTMPPPIPETALEEVTSSRKRPRAALPQAVYLQIAALDIPKWSKSVVAHRSDPVMTASAKPSSAQKGGPSLSSSNNIEKFDYNTCLEAIRANGKKSLAQCSSCLTQEQHKKYRPLILTWMNTGILPAELPEREAVREIVEREQSSFFHKMQEVTIGCSLCNLDRHRKKNVDADAALPAAPHVCLNHNYLPNALLERNAATGLSYVDCCIDVAKRQLQFRSYGKGIEHRHLLTDSTADKYIGPRQGRIVHEVVLRDVAPNVAENAPLAVFPPSHRIQLPEVPRTVRTLGEALTSDGSPSSSIRLSFDTLVALATAHLSNWRNEFHIPALVTHTGECDLNNVCRAPISAREIYAAACYESVVCDGGLSLSRKQQFQITINLDGVLDNAALLVASTVYANNISERLVVPLVKLEYCCKGYNTLLDEPADMLFEEFSKRELIFMHLALSIHPQAQVQVFRVNAYTSAVMAVESFSLSSFTANVWTPNDKECSAAWSVAVQLLQLLRSTVSGCAGEENPVLVSKCGSSRELVVRGGPSAALAAQSLLRDISLEPSSIAVAKREYLPPCTWPHQQRIPFTFRPKDAASHLTINHTQSIRDAHAYAEHDVWTNTSTTYSTTRVGSTAVVRLVQ